ncbi:uncharacterized protein V6R79_019775 [Siganus canaliculatus]
MAKSNGSDYFKRSSLFWMITVTLSMTFFTTIVFTPETIPFQHLGPFGTFCTYLVDNHADMMYKVFCAAWAIHVLEALFAMMQCSKKGITDTSTRFLWFIQTFLFGFASLGLLIKYDPKRPKQH